MFKIKEDTIKESKKLNYDLSEIKNYHIQAKDIVLKLVPEIDNLMELLFT